MEALQNQEKHNIPELAFRIFQYCGETRYRCPFCEFDSPHELKTRIHMNEFHTEKVMDAWERYNERRATAAGEPSFPATEATPGADEAANLDTQTEQENG